MKKINVGVIGNGFVGESIAFAFSPTCEIKVYDKARNPYPFLKIGNNVFKKL